MNNPMITYRGASIRLAEINSQDAAYHALHSGPEAVRYRGAKGKIDLGQHPKHTRKISFRGATAEMEV